MSWTPLTSVEIRPYRLLLRSLGWLRGCPRGAADNRTSWHLGDMLGRKAWRRAQEDRAALANEGILYALLDEDADLANIVHAQLADPEAAVWALTGSA